MRKIYKYFLFVFACLGMTLSCFAQDAMNLMRKEKSISSTQLSILKNITFTDTQMLIYLENGSVIKHDFSNFDNVIFGEYVPFVGIDELTSDNVEFNVYLSDDKTLTIESSAIIKSLKLVDLSGKTTKVDLSGNATNRVSASVESLTTGVYIVLADTESGAQTSKIIIK